MQQLAIDFATHVLKKLDQEVPKLWVLEEWYHDFKSESHIQVGLFRMNQEVAWWFEMKPEDLHKRTRKEKFSMPRQVAQYVMSEFGHTHEAIGKFYGQDQSNIANSKKKIQDRMDTDKLFRKNIENILHKILSIS